MEISDRVCALGLLTTRAGYQASSLVTRASLSRSRQAGACAVMEPTREMVASYEDGMSAEGTE